MLKILFYSLIIFSSFNKFSIIVFCVGIIINIITLIILIKLLIYSKITLPDYNEKYNIFSIRTTDKYNKLAKKLLYTYLNLNEQKKFYEEYISKIEKKIKGLVLFNQVTANEYKNKRLIALNTLRQINVERRNFSYV